ncbi:sugar phosphate isomerase/epimerase family protein [Pectobacterium brasiliense]|uniref:Sugar phosphate isomerase/epimerase n=1 Tax=Pectobacterium brasiliense TaxID=180957 RepID=A0A3S1AGD0_9GAMM|nr:MULTISPECIES: sugar phosphate isomerase/epimerase family protein [Pectobacterium]GKW28783.1 xylose isomerase [Pectobacterium carotovorum subsp. carotovorum]MBN3048309.1 sugar phosphate isomerase/epimerase [Pectobacterium brasiliense]MBN3075692.1 sugar phosphate isomerase/epimerase [Pectobacterium brasiliense]MBN3084847.1 sugar phosphate isomerase/epimerase [Pectobacterium brasiliense]MBN3091119.1 sugar phosphate isomerase/epimerase [Pectobacterium brasiliense]
MATYNYPKFGAGLWHFANYIDRYAVDGYGPALSTIDQIKAAKEVGELSYVDLPYPFTPGVTLSEVKDALKDAGLKAIGITPEIYLQKWSRGAFTNPDPAARAAAFELMHESADIVRELGANYVKVWPGQDGWDYPFQVSHKNLWKLAVDGMRDLAGANPDVKFAIEYKPREPRVKMTWDSAARTLLGIEDIGLDNVGVLLDFGHALYGGESPADSAQLIIDRGRLFGMDVNDNLRGWDDDLVVGTVHMTEIFEFFYVLKINNWQGVWQLDQFPFRENHVEAAQLSIRFLKHIYRALDKLDIPALQAAQEAQNPLQAQRIVQDALLSSINVNE